MRINTAEVECFLTGAVIGIVGCAVAALFHPHPMALPFALKLTFAAAIVAGIVLIGTAIAHAHARKAGKQKPPSVLQPWEVVSSPPHIHPTHAHVGRLAEVIELAYRTGGPGKDSFWGPEAEGPVPFVVLEASKYPPPFGDLLLCRPFGDPGGPRRWIPATALSIASEGRKDPALSERAPR
ncbi:MAG: hypothetical protein AB7V08_13950 [Elusimicrobiales bacterium]